MVGHHCFDDKTKIHGNSVQGGDGTSGGILWGKEAYFPLFFASKNYGQNGPKKRHAFMMKAPGIAVNGVP
jgi:hypothetical protein